MVVGGAVFFCARLKSQFLLDVGIPEGRAHLRARWHATLRHVRAGKSCSSCSVWSGQAERKGVCGACVKCVCESVCVAEYIFVGVHIGMCVCVRVRAVCAH